MCLLGSWNFHYLPVMLLLGFFVTVLGPLIGTAYSVRRFLIPLLQRKTDLSIFTFANILLTVGGFIYGVVTYCPGNTLIG